MNALKYKYQQGIQELIQDGMRHQKLHLITKQFDVIITKNYGV